MRPVMCSTAPIDIISSPLKITSLNAWGDRARKGQGSADADAADHESDLVDHAIGEHPPQVVLDDRVEDGKAGHRHADVDEHLRARKAAGERVHRDLGGEHAEVHGAGRRRLRIGIGQPVVHEGKRALDPERCEQQQPRDAVRTDLPEREGTRGTHVDESAREQQHSGQNVGEQVAQPGAKRSGAAPRPDEAYRRERHQLPEHEERQQIAGKDRAQRRPRVDQRCDVLHAVAQVQGEQGGEEGREVKEPSEHQAEAIHPQRRELHPEPLEGP